MPKISKISDRLVVPVWLRPYRCAYSRLPCTEKCGNNKSCWNTYPIPRRCAGRLTRCSLENKTSSFRAICPSVGAKAPEIACAIVDFPAPERPNNAVTPDPALNAMSKLNPENWCLMETFNVIDHASVFEHAAPTTQTATKQSPR